MLEQNSSIDLAAAQSELACGNVTEPLLPLSPAWTERLARHQEARTESAPVTLVLPLLSGYYADRVVFVNDRASAESLLDFAQQRPLAFIGFDTEFRYRRPGVVIDARHTAYDPRSIQPLLLSLALAEPSQPGGRLYRFVVDLRVQDVLESLKGLFRLPCCFIGHFTHVELMCLLQLGLPEPTNLWDTWVHEKALHLGRHHKRYRLPPGAGEAEQARASQEAQEDDEFSNSLVSTCRRYGVDYGFASDKARLQQSFLGHADGVAFTQEQIEYAAADAVAAARLYQPQVLAATQSGILQHLITVEMPWVVTNARMVWNGVRIDQEKCGLVSEACVRHLEVLQPKLDALGVPNVGSHKQLKGFFKLAGLLDLFQKSGSCSFDKNRLAEFEDRHPAIPLIRAARRVHELQRDKILTGEFVGSDGRVHPEYRHLGTQTGRQTCKWPNVLGLGRTFRPLIVAEPGRGVGEVDWSQIEVGIAAAVYHDDRLVEMFNRGDVYSAMAQDFHRAELSEEDRNLTGKEFKRKYSSLRNQMKTCTLGIIYGLTPHGLANRLKVHKDQAAALQDRFMTMFPALKQALATTPACGAIRGYVTTFNGLRRNRSSMAGPLTGWERNWMTNHPVQGSAAVVFKAAGNRLDRLYHLYDAWIIIPMHDAFVFEAPMPAFKKVAELTERVMCETVQEFFPMLRPQVEVNISNPECWNKDGHADAVERWIEDPTYTFA